MRFQNPIPWMTLKDQTEFKALLLTKVRPNLLWDTNHTYEITHA